MARVVGKVDGSTTVSPSRKGRSLFLQVAGGHGPFQNDAALLRAILAGHFEVMFQQFLDRFCWDKFVVPQPQRTAYMDSSVGPLDARPHRATALPPVDMLSEGF